MTRRGAPSARAGWAASAVSGLLPEFPWDRLVPYAERARRHPDGLVDLSVGTPVDPTPNVVQSALRTAADAPGYPSTHGTAAVRAAAAGWVGRRCGAAVDPANVLPAIGAKELVGWLPTLLGLGPEDLVVVPEIAYPTYEVGARLANCRVLATDSTLAVGPRRAAVLWLNSPANPTGRVLGAEHLAKVVAWARERGTLVVSDECYLEFGWDAEPVSVLHPSVCGTSHAGVLALHSLSKRSNLAGYRAGFVAGDPAVVHELLAIRKHVGMMVPTPVQAAMAAALNDDEHVKVQRGRYAGRRDRLLSAVASAGFRVEQSAGSIYLWVTRGEPCWDDVGWLAERGVLAAPGEFYGPAGARHVRLALTATDERVDAAVTRLTG